MCVLSMAMLMRWPLYAMRENAEPRASSASKICVSVIHHHIIIVASFGHSLAFALLNAANNAFHSLRFVLCERNAL